MLWIIFMVLLVLWLLGLATAYTIGGLIHLLLVIALVVLAINIVQGRSALIILGIVALAYQGITYKTREKIVDIGPLQATAEKEKTVPLPPLLGGLALAGGVVLVVVGSKKS